MTAPDPRLEEIEGRLSKATPGPWVHQSTPTGIRNGGTYDFIVLPHGGIIAERHVNGTYADADFIAHAPADVAYLLAELRKAQDKLARVEGLAAEVSPTLGLDLSDDDFDRGWHGARRVMAAELRAAVADATGGGQ